MTETQGLISLIKDKLAGLRLKPSVDMDKLDKQHLRELLSAISLVCICAIKIK